MPLAGAGMRRHVHAGNHAAESFVSFIPLFGGAPFADSVARVNRLPSQETVVIGIDQDAWIRLHKVTVDCYALPWSATDAAESVPDSAATGRWFHRQTQVRFAT